MLSENFLKLLYTLSDSFQILSVQLRYPCPVAKLMDFQMFCTYNIYVKSSQECSNARNFFKQLKLLIYLIFHFTETAVDSVRKPFYYVPQAAPITLSKNKNISPIFPLNWTFPLLAKLVCRA